MTAAHAEDLATLARDLARAARALRLARHALATDPTALAAHEASSGQSPLDAHRHVAGKKTYDALLARPTSRADEALRASCARWVAELTMARLGWDTEVAEARALREPRPSGTRAATREPTEGIASDALRGLLGADTAEIAGPHVTAAARHGARVRAPRDERRTRLDEVARRLGRPGRFGRALVHLDPVLGLPASREAGEPEGTSRGSSGGLVVTASADLIAVLAGELSPGTVKKTAPDDGAPGLTEEALVGSAARFLRASEPLAKDVLARAYRARTAGAAGAGPAAVDTWRLASAREARGAEWPARLTGAWVQGAFAGFGELAVGSAQKLPAPVGAGSFLRAAWGHGEALHRQESLRYSPFPLAEDPHFVAAHRTGGLFALAVASPPFLVRELGASRAGAVDTSKALHTSLLFALRARAFAWLVAVEGVTERVRELDAATFGPHAALDFLAPRPHDDEPARWYAALTTHAAHAELVATHDDDWYRNPRAARAFVARFARPALATTFLGAAAEDLDAEALRVAKAFERELG